MAQICAQTWNSARTDKKQKVWRALDFMSRRPKSEKKPKKQGSDPLFARLDTYQKLSETHGRPKR